MNVSKLFGSLEQIKVSYRFMCDELLNEFNLPRTSFDILLYIANNPEIRTNKEISEGRHIKKNVVSLHVDRLVNEGYLVRKEVKGDRRKIHLFLTSKADEVIKKGRAVQCEFARLLTEGISKEDIQKFKCVFYTIIENASKINEKIERISL